MFEGGFGTGWFPYGLVSNFQERTGVMSRPNVSCQQCEREIETDGRLYSLLSLGVGRDLVPLSFRQTNQRRPEAVETRGERSRYSQLQDALLTPVRGKNSSASKQARLEPMAELEVNSN